METKKINDINNNDKTLMIKKNNRKIDDRISETKWRLKAQRRMRNNSK